jgi:trehalose 6-phosphate phosphatase
MAGTTVPLKQEGELAERLGTASGPLTVDRLCLFLDIDGTLLDFVDSPRHVAVDAELVDLLNRAARATSGAVALVSGRSLAQIDELFAPTRWPAAGRLGLARRDRAGAVHRGCLDASEIERARRQFEQLTWRHPQIEVEDKGLTVALHFRRAPELGPELTQEVQGIVDSLGGNYRVQPGSCVLEITPRGASKADAVEAFLDEPPFKGLEPLYAGDDLTDLAAFEAVERLGGVTIAVGDRVRARLNFPTVMHFRRYLAGLVDT